jgi:MFS family permease
MKITFPLSTLLNIGVFVTGIQLIRECRKLVIPLAAIDLGMSNEDVGWYSTISYGIDAMLFSAAGIVMDKFGRNFCAVSSVSIMALSQLILVPGVSYFTLLLNAIIGGIGNGLSSGIILAYGADLAPETPPESKAQFLAYYRLIGDFGEFFGPIVVGALAQFTSTPTMINTLCTISVASIYWLIWTIPEPLTMLNTVEEVSLKPLSSAIKAAQEEEVVERKDEYTS